MLLSERNETGGKSMNSTLEYYDNDAASFVSGTKDIDFSEIQNLFLSYDSVRRQGYEMWNI